IASVHELEDQGRRRPIRGRLPRAPQRAAPGHDARPHGRHGSARRAEELRRVRARHGVHDRARAHDPRGSRLCPPRGHDRHHAERLGEHGGLRADGDRRDREADGRARHVAVAPQAGVHGRALKPFRALAISVLLAACSRPAPQSAAVQRPPILLVTLDTTRADAIGPDAHGGNANAFGALTRRGRWFPEAYATVPETLPSHTSMMTGLYPGGHGVHQNARYVSSTTPLVAEQLQRAGYHTEAFVSAFVLNRRFGLARGFDLYDDDVPAGRNERNARETTDAVVQDLRTASPTPRFLWVHYYDPHAPYDPPEPYRTRYAKNLYLGEVDFMDEQMGRLIDAFDKAAPGPRAVI